MGMFATTLLTLSLAMMGFRGVREQAVFVGNLCFAAGIGMFVSAQWEMILGNTFSYTVLTAFCKKIGYDAHLDARSANLMCSVQPSSTPATASSFSRRSALPAPTRTRPSTTTPWASIS